MTATFGAMSISDGQAQYAYAASFGNLKSKTMYAGLPKGTELKNAFDLRGQLRESFSVGMKALTTTAGGAGTAGYALIPVYVDPRIVDQSRKYTPLTELLPRVTNLGMTADYNVITGKGTAFFGAEDAALSETNDTYDRSSEDIKFLYAVGRVTGPAIATVPPYVLAGHQSASGAAMMSPFGDASAPNAMQLEVLNKARSMKEKEEDTILNGDSSANSLEFDGVIAILGSTNRRNPASGSGGDIALSDVDLAAQDAFDDGGRPDLAVCNSRTYTDIIGLLNQKIGYLQPSQLTEWGFSEVVLNTMVGPIRLIPSMFLSNTADTGRLIFLDTSVIEMRVLQDMSYEELAKTNDSQKFMLKEYLCMVIKAPSFCAQIYEID